VLCDTVRDKDVLLSAVSIVLPLALLDIIVTLSPSPDNTTQPSMSNEIRIAMKSHEAHFFTRGLALVAASSILAPPTMIF